MEAEGSLQLRDAVAAELDQLAGIWHDGWQDAHAAILPAELARVRTLENFRQRLAAGLHHVRVAGPPNRPTGFCITHDDELYQLFVAPAARGTGTAAALVSDAEHRIAARGYDVAWLACAIGNNRAARFYEKCGWRRSGVVTSELDTPAGVFRLDVWRYEKRVGR